MSIAPDLNCVRFEDVHLPNDNLTNILVVVTTFVDKFRVAINSKTDFNVLNLFG